MTKKQIGLNELEQLALQMLKETPLCEGAQMVSIEPSDENLKVGNWRIVGFDSGSSERDACEAALWDIEDKLLPEYDLVS